VNGDPSTSLAVRLRQAEAAIRDQLLPLLVEHRLSMEHWRIMAVVDDHPGIGMGSLASTAVVPAATLTRHTDKLVELGIVVRHVDPADKRRVVLALSPRGRDLATRLRTEERRAAVADGRDLTGTDTQLQTTA
jgi:DNA-binding MarR family transcriptional regulator